MFYLNYVRLCNKTGKKPSAVAEELGMSRAAVNGWKKGSTPNDATLQKIADYFGVAIAEILADEQKENPASTEWDGIKDRVSNMSRTQILALMQAATQRLQELEKE